MNLKDKINQDLKEAMKSGNKLRLQTIRSIRALILEFEKSGTDKELTPDEEIKLLSGAAKKRKDSIEQYENANRQDLADKEKQELEIIREYLPEQLSEDEVLAEVKKLADEIGARSQQDFPKLMPKAIQKLKGQADGKLVKDCVEKVLSGN